MDEQDEAESTLIASVAKADMVAFENLYRLYEKRVYRYACTFVRDSAAAEEVALDAMMAVWNGAAGFRGGSRVSTWIFGIVRHKALDAVRKSARDAHHDEMEAAAQVADGTPGPADVLSNRQTAAQTQQALSTLTPEHREILHLVFFEELPYEQIAVLLGIPTNTVKTRVYYAKRQLRQALERSGPGGAS